MSGAFQDDHAAERLIEAAHAFGPKIVAMREQIEQERRLPSHLVEELRQQGFFSLWLAREFGGPELSLTDVVKVIESISQYDGSVGWCVMNAGGYSRFSGLLPEPFARQLFGEQRAVVAGNLGPGGTATIVPGGYRITGRWAYGSGIPHCDWILGGCVVQDGNGPRRLADGTPETRIVFVPARDATVIDTWHVGGLRGTGSHDYQITNVFVPEDRTSSVVATIPRALYRLPRHTAFSVPVAAVPLGIARAAIDAARKLSSAKTPRMGAALLRDRPVVQGAIGRAEAMLRGARAFLLEACEDAWEAIEAGESLTVEQRAVVRLACAQSAEAAKTVVQMTYDIGGGSSVYEDCPLQRCFRDAHAATQHVQIYGANFETGGRVLLGLEPGTPIL